ncbi:MAG: hypothetical protein KDC74_06800 [Flavobacteriaceae bacterium]|nr:hypothetical protein [Flavobacteriaceae bacterium]
MAEILYPDSILSVIQKMTSKIKEDLDPDYILLSGSFGKGSWLYLNDNLLSDFEFVFVCKKRWSLSKKKRLLNQLNETYPFEISLKGYLHSKILKKIISNYSFKNPGYVNLDFYDTFSKPNIIYSKYREDLNINLKPIDIPVWEAWRLFVNRLGNILSINIDQGQPKYLEKYYWLKIFEAIADSYLIIRNEYTKDVNSRYKIFQYKLLANDATLSSKCLDSFHSIKSALKARKEHDMNLFDQSISKPKMLAIVNSWTTYLECKLEVAEHFEDSNKTFIEKYNKNKSIQGNYLEVTGNFSKIVSNGLRLFKNRNNLINNKFKFYMFNYSWRHMVLLSVYTYFIEMNHSEKEYMLTKKVFSTIVNGREVFSFNENDLLINILKYWKTLR